MRFPYSATITEFDENGDATSKNLSPLLTNVESTT
jgi:hypothetical protein